MADQLLTTQASARREPPICAAEWCGKRLSQAEDWIQVPDELTWWHEWCREAQRALDSFTPAMPTER